MTSQYQVRDFGNGVRFLGRCSDSGYKVCKADNESWCEVAALAAAGDLRAVHYGPAAYGHVDYFFVPGRGRAVQTYIISECGLVVPA